MPIYPQSSDALYEELIRRVSTARERTRATDAPRSAGPGWQLHPRSSETLPGSSAPPSERLLSVELHHEVTAERLVLSGELDTATAPEFERAMLAALDAGRPLLLDLTGLRFIDSSGLWAITLGHSVCRRRGTPLTIAPGTGPVRQIFEATGLYDVLPCAEIAPRG